MTAGKKVSVIIPCRNEVQHIERCVRDAFDFEPPEGGFEVIVAEGRSNDGTRDILYRLQKNRYRELRVIDNPAQTVPHGMNLAIQQAAGEYIIRIDVRCIHPRKYLIDLLGFSQRTKADNVGGVLYPIEGESYMEKCIAWAYKSPISMGGALRERMDFIGETDTVYGGCFRRKRLIEVGMYDEEMVRNQDDELSFRLREKGGKIIQNSRIQIRYFPRKYLRQVFRQFLQYGYWKVAVIKKHPQQASVRHFMPAALVSAIGLGGILASLHAFFFTGWIVLVGSYLASVGFESLRITSKAKKRDSFGVWLTIICIHMGFGVGFLTNLFCRLWGLKPKLFETLTR